MSCVHSFVRLSRLTKGCCAAILRLYYARDLSA